MSTIDLTIEKERTRSYLQGRKYWSKGGNVGSADNIHLDYMTDSFSGVKNPEWKHQVAEFENAATPMEGVQTLIRQVRPCRSHFQSTSAFPHLNWETFLTAFPRMEVKSQYQLMTYPLGDSAELALSHLHNKLNSAFQAIMAGVIAGESRETIGMIRDRGNKIGSGLHRHLGGVKKSLLKIPKARRAAQVVKIAADSWLEYSFGWAPFVADIESAIDYANTTRPDKRVVVATSDSRDASHYNCEENHPWGGITWTVRDSMDVSVRYYAGVKAKDSREGRRYQKLGIAPENWLPTLYELIPFSFLVDYFANLDAIVSAIGNYFIDVRWVNRVDRKVQLLEASNPGTTCWESRYAQTGHALTEVQPTVIKRKYVKRTPDVQAGIPSLVFSLPGSLRQVINMIALAAAHDRVRSTYSRK